MAPRQAKKRRHNERASVGDATSGAVQEFPSFSGVFTSWEEFQENFKRYQEETHQLYRLRTTVSVKDRNNARTNQASARGTTAELWDESLGSELPNQAISNSRSTECPAKLSVNLIKEKEGFKVRVKRHQAGHNHIVHPKGHRADSATLQHKSNVLEDGPKKKSVQGGLITGGDAASGLFSSSVVINGDLSCDDDHDLDKRRREVLAVCQKLADAIAIKDSKRADSWIRYLTKLEKLASLGDFVPDGSQNMVEVMVTDKCDVPNLPEVGGALTTFTRMDAQDDNYGDDGDDGDAGGVTTFSADDERDFNGLNSSPAMSSSMIDGIATQPIEAQEDATASRATSSETLLAVTEELSSPLSTTVDITLSTLREYVDKKKLSFSVIEPIFSAIALMYESSMKKRPKASIRTPGDAALVATKVSYVLPEILVLKSIEAAKNAEIREQATNNRALDPDDITVDILDIGTFSLRDINTMKEWHSLSKKIECTRRLISWIMEQPESDHRTAILAKVRLINMYSTFSSRLGNAVVEFEDLADFAGPHWLSDGCVVAAALHVAEQMQSKGHGNGGVQEIFVVNAVLLTVLDDNERTRALDTDKKILSKGISGRVVFFPVNIEVDVGHWCGVILDFRSCTIWIYEPKRRSDYFDEVEAIVRQFVMPLIDAAFVFTIRASTAWLQQDGYSCGVLVVQWLETYLKVAMNTNPDDDLQTLTPKLISHNDICDCRYKLFAAVFFDVCDE